MIDWHLILVLTLIAYIMAAIWGLVERVCK